MADEQSNSNLEATSPIDPLPSATPSPVLPYQTPPSLGGATPKSRWKISGKATKRVTCGKCGCMFRYEIQRTVRSWSMTSVVAGAVMVGLLLLSCFLPFAFIVTAPIAIGRVLKMAIRSTRMAHGGVSALRQGGDYVSANRRLRVELDTAVEPVACPKCSWYQPNMVREARARTHNWVEWPMMGLLFAAPFEWLIVWKWHLAWNFNPFDLDASGPAMPAILVVAGTLVVLGLIAGSRWLVALSVDPNKVGVGAPSPFPNAPLATTEADWAKSMAAQTTRITATRQPRAAGVAIGPRRIVPPPPKV